MLYGLGGLALIAVFWYLVRAISIYIGQAPARGKGIHPDAMRYFNALEGMLSPYGKDADVIECLIAANKELQSQFNSYQGGNRRDYPVALFGPDSFEKNREEVWAIWVLLNYSNRSTTINNMQDRLLKRMKELAEDEAARPPVLFEDCRLYQEYVLKCQREEEDRIFKQRLTECIARTNYRKLFPDTSMDTMLTVFEAHRYEFDLYTVDDLTQSKINKIVNSLAKGS